MKKRKIILIVDDEELNRAILAELFHDEYAILEAENGETALSMMENNIDDIAVILLDIIMPVVDGFEVMEKMNKHYWTNRMPVVMITTDTSESSMKRGYELGAADVITKPFNSSIVRQRVKNIIALYRHKRNLELLASEQIDILKNQSEKIQRNHIGLVSMLNRIIKMKVGKVGEQHSHVGQTAAVIMREYSHIHPELSIGRSFINTVSAAADICDIGKIFIPDDIFNKNGNLTEKEFSVVKSHSLDGANFIERISGSSSNDEFLSSCSRACLYHHERADGSGYPYGLREEDIPLEAQIAAISSVYDALVNDRPYRKAFSHNKAVEMIQNGECGAFGKDILTAFIAAESDIEEIYLPENDNFPDDNEEFKSSADSNSERILRLLEKERTRYQILSDMSGDVMFEYEGNTNTISFSDSFSKFTGLESKFENADSFVALTEAMFDEDKARLQDIYGGISPEKPSFKTELRLKMKNGTYRWFELYAHSAWNDNKCISIMGKLVNIDRQKRETEQWRRAADMDLLTKIYNKIAVQNYITDALETGEDNLSALCFVDLDNFKRINDTYGHQFGDMVLKKVADQLKTSVRNTDIVGRIGGDEFVVFLKNIGSRKNIAAKAEQLCSVFKLSCGECKISGSIGIACYPDDAVEYNDLLEKADHALYYCKGIGKDSYVFYNEEYCIQPYKSLLSETENNNP